MKRFIRHRKLLSDAAWQRLEATPIVCAGAGGLGSHVLESLVRLGPVTVQLWDPGYVAEENLNRQILYGVPDIGRPKADVASEKLQRENPSATLLAVSERLTADSFEARSAELLTDGRTFVLFDCLDSFSEREGLAAIQKRHGCTIFHGGVERWYGQVTTLSPGGRSYEDVFGVGCFAAPRAAKPILPHVVATIAASQVGEYLQWLEAPGTSPLDGAVLLYDGKNISTRTVTVARRNAE